MIKALVIIIFTGLSLNLFASEQQRYLPSKNILENFVVIHDSNLNEALKTPVIFHNSFTQETHFILVTKKDQLSANINSLYLLEEDHNFMYWLYSPSENKSFRQKIIQDFSLKSVMNSAPIFELIPSANANCYAPAGDEFGQRQLSNYVNESSLADNALSCLKGVLEGAWDATGGMVVSGANYIYDLFTSPKETLKRTYEQFKGAVKAIANLGETLDKFSSFFGQLDSSSKAHLLCSFFGAYGPRALLALITAGAGSGALILGFTQYLQRFSKIERFISLVSKGKSLAQTMPKKFLQKLAQGKIAEKTLKAIDRFAEHNMPDLARSAVQCAL